MAGMPPDIWEMSSGSVICATSSSERRASGSEALHHGRAANGASHACGVAAVARPPQGVA